MTFQALHRRKVGLDSKPCDCAKVLLVDDNHINLLALRMILRSHCRVETDEVSNGEQAVARARASLQRYCCGPYRVVFMDINMSIMDGYTATEEIRMFLSKQKTYIVGASAYPSSEIEARGNLAGMDEYLSKPINPD